MACTYETKETLLTLSKLCLRLGTRPVLNDVCARVRNVTRPGLLQGQVVAVLGPSGVAASDLPLVAIGAASKLVLSVRALPGVRYRRHWLNRYSLVWRKPEEPTDSTL